MVENEQCQQHAPAVCPLQQHFQNEIVLKMYNYTPSKNTEKAGIFKVILPRKYFNITLSLQTTLIFQINNL